MLEYRFWGLKCQFWCLKCRFCQKKSKKTELCFAKDLTWMQENGQEIKHVKTEHVKTDRLTGPLSCHFSTWKRGDGTPLEHMRRYVQGSVNGHFHMVVRVLWANEIPLPPFCSRRRKRWKTNGEKMVDFWCRFFSRFGADFFHGLHRFFTVCKGHKRWKKNISLLMNFFTVSFSRFAPSRFALLEVRNVVTFMQGPHVATKRPYRKHLIFPPKKGVLESKKKPNFHPFQRRELRVKKRIPIFPYGALYGENGDFLTQSSLFWGGGEMGVFRLRTLLLTPFFADFDPVRGEKK